MSNNRYYTTKRSNSVPAFSIIVPAYNASSSIVGCIQSIQSQTVHDFEVIVVDDGSQDDTAQIVKRLIQDDRRFKLVSKANGGVSRARNTGLDHARGRFIMFVDSDDIILPDMLQEFEDVRKSNAGDYQMLMCNLIQRSEKRDTLHASSFDNQGSLDTLAKDIPELIKCKQILSPWAKVYSRSVIEGNNMRFHEGLNLGEDLTFNLDFLKASQSYRTTNYTGYIYKTDSIDSLSKKVSLETFREYDDIYRRGLVFCKNLALGRAARAAFAKHYLSSVYYGLGIVMQLDTARYKRVLASLDRDILTRAAKSTLGSGMVGIGLAIPILSKSSGLLSFFVYLRQVIKRRIR